MSEFNYTPPVTPSGNQDTGQLAELVAKLQAQIAAAGLNVEPVKELSAEEKARNAIDNAGAGLGTAECLAELYRHLDTIAKKVGI